MRVSKASWRTSLRLHHVSALLWGKVLDAKLNALDRAVKASFDPNQPRVPAGNPDGGQWTDAGRSGGDDGISDVRIAQARRGGRGRGSDAEATDAQLIIRDIREAQAREAIRRAREIDPGWRPTESVMPPESVPGQIRRAEDHITEAQARLRELAHEEPNSIIDAFRRGHGLDLLGDQIWSREQNTVAHCSVDDQPFIGVNSRALTYSTRDETTATQLRNQLARSYPGLMNKQNLGGAPNNAVFHAETTCLLRAARANGGTLSGKTVVVTIDREMCLSCERILPSVGLELGNPEVTFVDPKGRVQIMRDGVWIKRR